jgi:hypothetical protein
MDRQYDYVADFDWYTGGGNSSNVYRLVDDKTSRRYRIQNQDGLSCFSSTNQCLRLFRDRTGATTIGYRIVPRSYGQVESFVRSYGVRDFDDIQKKWEELSKHTVCEVEGTGYDRMFLIGTHGLGVENGDLEVDSGSSKAKISSAFRRAQTGKKGSRELTNRIMEMVA